VGVHRACSAFESRTSDFPLGKVNFPLRLQLGARERHVAADVQLACCAIEMMASQTSRFELARCGSEVFGPSPRQAALMIVAVACLT